ncbi:MAG TPA: hypothetical protein VE993_11300, partial [Stellaceae bacterium]|nr:hypothetical protein [Stellaceae bacterium]
MAQPPAVRTVEIVTFADPHMQPVRVLRGAGGASAPAGPRSAPAPRTETVRFADPAEAPVTVIRGPALAAASAPFAPAGAADLDLVAFAVDGAESRHGADPGM